MDTQRIAEELARRIHLLTNSSHGCRMEQDLVPDVAALIATAMQSVADGARVKGMEQAAAKVGSLYQQAGSWVNQAQASYCEAAIRDDIPHTPRTAQQSEAVIAKALGKHLTVVKEGADRG